jgi:hypothetical protein
MLSNAYQMSSHANPAGLAADPQNDFFWRFDTRRLSAEEIRDSVLAVSGNLNPQMFGASIYPFIPDEVKAGQSLPGQGWEDSTPSERGRRSVYIHTKRSLIVPMIEAFDGPDVDNSCPVRFSTVQPTQSLSMMNGEFLNEQAREFAADIRRAAGDDRPRQLELVLGRVLQRVPTAQEVDQGMQLLESLQQEHDVDEAAALDYYCLVALNLNEFVFLD